MTDKVNELQFKLAEKETQVKTILGGLDMRESQERSLDSLISAAIEDKVSWEKRYRHAVSELELKTQYLDDKENFWSSEMQQLENRIEDQQGTITSLKEQLLGLRKMQESGNLAAFGRQSAALKERSSLIHGNSDLAKKLGETTKKLQIHKQLIESLEAQLEISKSQNNVFTSALIPILENSGLFLQSMDAYEISENIKALIDSLLAELRLTGKQRKLKLSSHTAKELLTIKEKTLESQQKQTKLLKELEYTTREAEKLTRAIMDDKDDEGYKAEDVKEVGDEEDSLRRDRSATLIQSRFKGYMAKKKYQELKDVQSQASRVIQKHYRVYQEKEDQRKREKAARTIQAGARRWKVKKQVREKRSRQASVLEDEVLNRAAKTLQSHERARQSRKKYAMMKAESSKAATTIQKHYRGISAKKKLKHRKKTAPAIEDFGIFCNESVITVGSLIRACGNPSNGTTLCLFQWTRGSGSFEDIQGATTPEYTVSPDDVGKTIGVKCTPTNDKDEFGLPAFATVNEGRLIEMKEGIDAEIRNISSKGTATFHVDLVKFGKSSISPDNPTNVTIILDKKQVSIVKKSNVLTKIKYQSLPEIKLDVKQSTFCPIKLTAGSDKGKEIHLKFKETPERDNVVLLIRHFATLAASKPKKTLLSFLSSKK